MKDNKWHIWVVLCCMIMASGCVRNQFDQQRYEEIVEEESPTPNVDENHDWMMSTIMTLVVDPSGVDNVNLVRIFTENPAETDFAEVVDEAYSSGDNKIVMNISYPIRLETLYAAAIDSEDYYTIVSFNPNSSSSINFANPIVKHQKMPYHYLYQTYEYLYEEEYPQPGDYDFNDVVMHIALERASTNVMYVHVRLAAVGADQQLAGCIRMPEIPFEEIDSVWTVNGASFNQDITSQYMMVLKERDLLLKGLNGEPVLNLFADAHWATGDNLDANYGMFKRKQYNVTKTTGSDAQLMVPREIVFGMRVKKGDLLTSMSLDNIDPFIIRQYNGSNMEIHTYDYRKINALNSYNFIDAGNIPWALKIPYGWFCHPLHGVNIGFRLEGQGTQYLFGAYRRSGNSFGEWSMNHLVSLRWFLPENATTNQVFVW